MASLYVLWNIKERRVEGIFGSSADATAAIVRVSGKSGGYQKTGGSKLAAADLEVLTATKP
jgi:hypothetical protein